MVLGQGFNALRFLFLDCTAYDRRFDEYLDYTFPYVFFVVLLCN
jgi:hypothetical protein